MLHAVVIGIDRYRDEAIPNLSCAASDAITFGRLLERRLAPDERSVRVLVDEEATQRNIRVAIGNDLAGAISPDDVVLIYFAGHGCPERVGAGDKPSHYLMAHDTDYRAIYGTALGMDTDVPEWFGRLLEAKLVTIILDCCFSGAAGGRTIMGPLLKVAGMKMMDLTGPISLKGLELGRGRVILCAADDNQVACENIALRHGVFTHHLLAALTKARGEESVVLLTDLYKEVERAVREETGGRQEPIMTALPAKRAALPCLGEEPATVG
jgi:uncharacterized caspase-like protein